MSSSTSPKMFGLLTLLAATPALAHMALYDRSMYGWEGEGANTNKGVNPLSDLSFKDWWFHGYIDEPPPEGAFMELPAGGTYMGQIACHRVHTTYGVFGPNHTVPERGCTSNPKDPNQSGALHSSDNWNTPLDKVKDVKGTAIGIVYESDVKKIKPEDFVIISTNQSSPWNTYTEFKIPAGLRECPPGGCHCMWGWVHGTKGGKPNEMYFLGYKCKVTNADPNGKPLPRPRIANKCPQDKSNCTVGAKQPHYWSQREGNNNFQDNGNDPPYYNTDYGFQDGAQTDLWKVPEDRTCWRKPK